MLWPSAVSVDATQPVMLRPASLLVATFLLAVIGFSGGVAAARLAAAGAGGSDPFDGTAIEPAGVSGVLSPVDPMGSLVPPTPATPVPSTAQVADESPPLSTGPGDTSGGDPAAAAPPVPAEPRRATAPPAAVARGAVPPVSAGTAVQHPVPRQPRPVPAPPPPAPQHTITVPLLPVQPLPDIQRKTITIG